MNTDKVYELYEEWYKENNKEGMYYEDAFLEFSAVLLEKLEAEKGRPITKDDLK